MLFPRFLFRKLSAVLSGKGIYLTRSLSYRSQKQALPPNFDYIRYSALGLCFEQILENNVAGNVAEVGVYKGDFAMRLNLLFRDRKLYLFDTFEGFAPSDVKFDQQEGFSEGNQDFSATTLARVKVRMPYPDQCEFRKGLFPSTVEGLEDQFCFVSLDADLFTPIYEGLKYFYPRLSRGGYVFVHDFNNEEYKGARAAVLQFTKEQKIGYIPIPDSGGTAILTK
jgi:O-methyltransferase